MRLGDVLVCKWGVSRKERGWIGVPRQWLRVYHGKAASPVIRFHMLRAQRRGQHWTLLDSSLQVIMQSLSLQDRKVISQIFIELDADGNGYLDRQEFGTCFRRLGFKLTAVQEEVSIYRSTFSHESLSPSHLTHPWILASMLSLICKSLIF